MHPKRQCLAVCAGRNGDRFVEGHAHPRAGCAKKPADVRAGFHATVKGVAVAIAASGLDSAVDGYDVQGKRLQLPRLCGGLRTEERREQARLERRDLFAG